MERERSLDATGSTGCRFEVPNVGLHRSDSYRTSITTPPLSDHRGYALDFDFVTHNRRRSMALDQIHVGRIHTGGFVGSLQGQLLPSGIWSGDSFALSVTRCANSLDHRIHTVAIAMGILETFEDHDSCAFAHHKAIGFLVKGSRMVG